MSKYTVLLFAVFFVGLSWFIYLRSSSDRTVNNEMNDREVTALTYTNISASDLKKELDIGKDIFLLDVHTPEQEHIEGTDDFIPFDQVTENQSKLPKNKNSEIVVYCRSGNMSEYASEKLTEMGYTNVKNLIGGKNAWNAEGY